MIVAPLSGRPEDALRIALLSNGWEGDLARSTADGVESLAFELREVPAPTLQALVASGGRLGLDVITGPDWALLAGARARLSALARPWTSPEPLVELATLLGHALPAEDPVLWQTAQGPVDLAAPAIVAILNLTPDSFSDGGHVAGPEAAVAQAARLLEDGATLLDVGGESTRPGATAVPAEEERARVVPAIEALARRFPGVPISIDTVKAEVAEAAMDAGAVIINDVSGLRLDPRMGAVARSRNAGLVLMHSRGAVAAMATDATGFSAGVVSGVIAELGAALGRARSAGIASDRIVVDPGLGFGKGPGESVELLQGLGALRVLGRPLMIGPSRKRFLGTLTGRPVEERDPATATACALGWVAGARLFRVHDPRTTKDALAVAGAFRPR